MTRYRKDSAIRPQSMHCRSIKIAALHCLPSLAGRMYWPFFGFLILRRSLSIIGKDKYVDYKRSNREKTKYTQI